METLWPYVDFRVYRFQDLTYLNRDLSKVIIIDTDPDHVSLQPENSVIITKWKGDPRDRELVGLNPFLECASILFCFCYCSFEVD